MKGISGIIGSVVVIILLLIAISLILVTMNYAYGIEQTEVKTIMSQLSQPHVTQVSPNSVVTSGRLLASYIIYPDGRVAPLNESVSGVKSFQSYLNGNPWAVVVFSNGQWVNITNVQVPSSNGGNSVSGVPFLTLYYPKQPFEPFNSTQVNEFLCSGTDYALPFYSRIYVKEQYTSQSGFNEYAYVFLNPPDTPVFGVGRFLAIPVTSENGWLNFTVTYYPSGNGGTLGYPVSFGIIVQNASVVDVIYFAFCYWWNSQQNSQAFNFTYGIFQFVPQPAPPYYEYEYNAYNFTNSTTCCGNYLMDTLVGTSGKYVSYDPIIKVAVKFTPGEPAVMYLWIGNYNGAGFSWYKVILPTTQAPLGTSVTIQPGWSWPDVTNTFPVNLYSYNETTINGNMVATLEPLVPVPGSTIEIVTFAPNPNYPSYGVGGTVVFNVTYTV